MSSAQLGLRVLLRSGPAVIVHVSTDSDYLHVIDHRNRPATVTYGSIKEYWDYLSIDELLTHDHQQVRRLGKRFAKLANEYELSGEKIPKWLRQRLSS